MADMEFKFSPDLYALYEQKMVKPHFGYVLFPPETKTAILNWMTSEYEIKCEPDWITDWPNMFGLLEAALLTMTK
jgi:cysteine-S-conjugate beta-lyase